MLRIEAAGRAAACGKLPLMRPGTFILAVAGPEAIFTLGATPAGKAS